MPLLKIVYCPTVAAEQRRCVREVSSSSVFTSLEPAPGSPSASRPFTSLEGEPAAEARSPQGRRAPSLACSTPIPRD